MSTQSKWSAWINAMPPVKYPVKLHVHGDFDADDKAKYTLVKAQPQGINPHILILEVKPKPEAGSTSIHLEYHEEVGDLKQYTQVQIREVTDVTVDVEIVS